MELKQSLYEKGIKFREVDITDRKKLPLHVRNISDPPPLCFIHGVHTKLSSEPTTPVPELDPEPDFEFFEERGTRHQLDWLDC